MSELKTTVQSIACGGTGGDLTYVDSKDGKIVRIRPIHYLDTYTEEELEPSMWEIKVGDKVFRPSYKALPNYFALAYKNRVYSKNRGNPRAFATSFAAKRPSTTRRLYPVAAVTAFGAW